MTVNDLVALAKVSHLTLTIMEHEFVSCQEEVVGRAIASKLVALELCRMAAAVDEFYRDEQDERDGQDMMRLAWRLSGFWRGDGVAMIKLAHP